MDCTKRLEHEHRCHLVLERWNSETRPEPILSRQQCKDYFNHLRQLRKKLFSL